MTRQNKDREQMLRRMADGEIMIRQRLVTMHDELGLLMRNLDRLVLPRPARRRRSTRKSYVDRVGNLVRFPRGDQK
jgi:hypothetical protein